MQVRVEENKENIGKLLEELIKDSDFFIKEEPGLIHKMKTFFKQKIVSKSLDNTLEGRLTTKKKVGNLSFSEEVIAFFENSSEYALNRFKTPVLTTEILFLTLLEQNNNKFEKILEKTIGNSLNWELFKYKIVKRIHREESALRDQVPKNQYYFAYLLKTQLTNNEFDQLISTEILSKGVELFRNTLMVQLLEVNLFKLLEMDIYKSMKVTNTRKYTA